MMWSVTSTDPEEVLILIISLQVMNQQIFFLTKNMTLIGKLRKNKPEIPALFLNGKPRHVHSFIFAFTNNLTLVSYIPARNKILILLLSGYGDGTCMGEGKDQKPEIIMHIMQLKVGMMIWSSLCGNTLVRDQQGAGL
jgi:hypothetical protein